MQLELFARHVLVIPERYLDLLDLLTPTTLPAMMGLLTSPVALSMSPVALAACVSDSFGAH